MGKYRFALCMECSKKWLIERGNENDGACPYCGAKHYMYRVIVEEKGVAMERHWIQQRLEEFIGVRGG